MRGLEALSRLISLGRAALFGSKGGDTLPPQKVSYVDVDFEARLINKVKFCIHNRIQYSAKRRALGCVNAAGNARQKW